MGNLKQEKKDYVFFDFDDTIFKGDSLLYWMRFYYKQRPLKRFFMITNWIGIFLYLIKIVDAAQLKKIFLMPLSYEDPKELDRLANLFLEKDLLPHCYKDLVDRVYLHQSLGHQVVIISASATFYLEKLEKIFPGCIILGTELVFPKKGGGLPSYRFGNIKDEGKIHLLEQLFPSLKNKNKWFTYSDSHHDFPLFDYVKFPVCIHPTDKLSARAKERKWLKLFPDGAKNIWKVRLWKLFLLFFLTENFEKDLSNCLGYNPNKIGDQGVFPLKTLMELIFYVKKTHSNWTEVFPALSEQHYFLVALEPYVSGEKKLGSEKIKIEKGIFELLEK